VVEQHENHTSKEIDANCMIVMETSRDKTHYTNQRLGVQIFIKSMTCKHTSSYALSHAHAHTHTIKKHQINK